MTDSIVAQLDQMRATYKMGLRSHFKEIVALAEVAWSSFQPDLDYTNDDLARLGEICRETAIACVSAEDGEPSLWRSRAYLLFTKARCTNGIALLMIPPAMSALREGNLEGALSHLELMAFLVDSSDSVIDGEMVRSAMLENSGIIRIEQREWELARELLQSVVEIESVRGDFRRTRKARASLTTIEYCSENGDSKKAIADLAQIIAECETNGGAGDVVETGTQNLERMNRNESVFLQYQVI
jgi:hypothetical protein